MINKKERDILKQHTVYDIIDALIKEKMLNEFNKEDVIQKIKAGFEI